MSTNIPRMMTITQIARTGILPEHAIRVMVKNGEIPAVYSGGKAFINFDNLCKKLQMLGAVTVDQVHTANMIAMFMPRTLMIHRLRGGS